jgi:hypothetical protein
MTKLVNLDAMLGGYFRLYFIIANVGNLDANLGVILNYFHNDICG